MDKREKAQAKHLNGHKEHINGERDLVLGTQDLRKVDEGKIDMKELQKNIKSIEQSPCGPIHHQSVVDFSLGDVKTIGQIKTEEKLKEWESKKFETLHQDTLAQSSLIKDFVRENEIDYIMNNHPVYVRMREQLAKGLKKYKTPVIPEHYSMSGWFNHIQQELTDALVYNEMMMMKTEEIINALTLAYKQHDPYLKDIQIQHALDILQDFKEGNK